MSRNNYNSCYWNNQSNNRRCRHNTCYNQGCRYDTYNYEYEPERYYYNENRNAVEINTEANIEQNAYARANGGNGGNGGNNSGDGGNGGDGGDIDIDQNASIEIENIVIISNDPRYTPRYVNLTNNGRRLEFNTDPNGNVLVNGQRMNEQELEDGTKVFVFRSNGKKKTNV